MERKSLLGIGIDVGPMSAFVERIMMLARSRRSSYVCVANAHMTVEASRDQDFSAIMASADLVTPDGMPLVWSLKLLHRVTQERVAGMDLFPVLLTEAERLRLKIYFYGSTKQVLEDLVDRARNEHPELQIAGWHSPPFRPLSVDEEQKVIEEINASNADMVLVSLGCPKQERWMSRQKGRIQGVMIGLGGAISVYTGRHRRAPAWMRRYCLEWLFRLMQEPGRMWRRYLVTNTLFLLLLGRELWTKKFAGTLPPKI